MNEEMNFQQCLMNWLNGKLSSNNYPQFLLNVHRSSHWKYGKYNQK